MRLQRLGLAMIAAARVHATLLAVAHRSGSVRGVRRAAAVAPEADASEIDLVPELQAVLPPSTPAAQPGVRPVAATASLANRVQTARVGAVATALKGAELIAPGIASVTAENGWSLHAFATDAEAGGESSTESAAVPQMNEYAEKTAVSELSRSTTSLLTSALDAADRAKGSLRGGPILAAAYSAMRADTAPDVGKAVVTVRFMRDGQHRVEIRSTGEASTAWPNFRRDLEARVAAAAVRLAQNASGLEVEFEIEALHQLYDGRDERLLGTGRIGVINDSAKDDIRPEGPRATMVGAVYNGRVCSVAIGAALLRSAGGLPSGAGFGLGLDCGVNLPSQRIVRVRPRAETRL